MEDNKSIEVASTVKIVELASLLGLGPAKLISLLFQNGVIVTINETIDFDTAAIIANELGLKLTLKEGQTKRPDHKSTDIAEDWRERAPIVAVMGHVDHGKTTLLDNLRSTDNATSEAGGITQHLSAYKLKINSNKREREITFIDTPGHEAFSVLREHGAKVTDIVLLVVAADDGVKPQTVEIIKLIKENDLNVVVAINKIDSEKANIDNVKANLAENGLVVEDYGGNVPVVEISAKKKTNLNKLLDLLFLVSDIEEHKANYSGLCKGIVLESHIEAGLGTVATVLVEQGCLNTNDVIVTSNTYGKIKSIRSVDGKRISKAFPSTPVLVSGLKNNPGFGEWFEEVPNETFAKEWLSKNQQLEGKSIVRARKLDVKDLDLTLSANGVKEIPVIVKADSAGSLESVINSLNSLGGKSIMLKIVGNGVGNITESDLSLAQTTKATIIGFHISLTTQINQMARRMGVEFRLHNVIYQLIDEIRASMIAAVGEETVEEEKASLVIKGIFSASKKLITLGGEVLTGIIQPNLLAKVYTEGETQEVVLIGELVSIKKEKTASKEAHRGELCGLEIVISQYNSKPQVGNIIKFYQLISRQREL